MSDNVFHAYIRAQYLDDGGGFNEFTRQAYKAANDVKRSFDSNMSAVKDSIERALAVPRNAGGSLDLGASALREAAAASEQRATAAREMAAAVRAAAQAEGDFSAEARQSVAAAEATAREYEVAAKAARDLATAQEQVQAQLNRTASGVSAVIAPTRGLTNAQNDLQRTFGANRQASLQVGQQIQDIAISLQGGQRATLVFAQQLPQLGFALAQIDQKAVGALGALRGFGTFASGPWGAAILVATLVLGSLTSGLFDNEEAANRAKDAAKDLSAYISDLGNFFDLATGKVKANSAALRENAAAQREADQRSRKTDRSALLATIQGKVDSTTGYETDYSRILGYSGGEPVFGQKKRPDDVANAFRSLGSSPGAVSRQLRAIAASNSPNARAAKGILDDLGLYARSLQQDQQDAAGVRSLDSGVLDPSLRKPNHTRTRHSRQRTTPYGATGDGFSARIDNIVAPFDDAPNTVDRVAKAGRDLDKVLYDIQQKKPPNMAGLIQQVEEARVAVQNGLTKPLQDYLKLAEERKSVDEAYATGGEDYANAMQDVLQIQRQMGPLTTEQENQVLATVKAERERAAVIRDQRALIQSNLNLVGDIRSNLQQTFKEALNGRANAGNFVARLFDSYTSALSERLTENLFGGALRELESSILGGNKVDGATDVMVSALGRGGTAVTDFADIVVKATSAVRGAPALAAANDNFNSAANIRSPDVRAFFSALATSNVGANDDGPEIVVTGQRTGAAGGLGAGISTPTEIIARTFAKGFKIIGLSDEASNRLGKVFSKSLEGAAIGGALGSLIGGESGGKTGRAIGGIIGGLSGVAEGVGGLAKAGSGLASIAGSLGTYGQIAAAAITAVTAIADLFEPGPSATAVITNTTGTPRITGNNDNAKAAVSQASSSVQSQLSTVIDALGADLGDFAVSIGQYKDYYRVSASGSGNAGDKRYPDGNRSDVIYDGKDANQAVRAAVINAIQDGAVQGIREGSKRLLVAGNDLQTQLNKALKFENVFVRLKEATDPLGAALDKVNKEFKGLKKIFEEAGASASELADLEKLYGIERTKAIKAATDELTSAYKSLLDQLTIGDNGRSLRDREAAARAVYDPLAADAAAGRTVDAQAYTDAARALLDIERQLYGSQPEFFALQDQIIAQLRASLGTAQGLIDAANGGDSPFAAPVVDALDQQTQTLLSALNAANDNLGTMIGLMQANGTGGAYTSSALNDWQYNF